MRPPPQLPSHLIPHCRRLQPLPSQLLPPHLQRRPQRATHMRLLRHPRLVTPMRLLRRPRLVTPMRQLPQQATPSEPLVLPRQDKLSECPVCVQRVDASNLDIFVRNPVLDDSLKRLRTPQWSNAALCLKVIPVCCDGMLDSIKLGHHSCLPCPSISSKSFSL